MELKVWNKDRKEMQMMQERDTLPLHKDVFVINKPLGKDCLGSTIFENDIVQIKDDLKIAVNILASSENIEDLNKGILIGNKFQGLTVTSDFISMHNIFIVKKKEVESDRKIKVKELSDSEKIEAGICPNCDSELIFQDGCKNCPVCGFSACGI